VNGIWVELATVEKVESRTSEQDTVSDCCEAASVFLHSFPFRIATKREQGEKC
jgi:hypothetical protein